MHLELIGTLCVCLIVWMKKSELKLKLKSEPKPWMTPQLLEIFKRCDLAFKLAGRYKDSPTRAFFDMTFRVTKKLVIL
jgi:hypothetical protein